MEVKPTLFIIAVLVIAIWIITELKKFKHKIFAIVLIFLILFSYLSAAIIFKGEDVNFKTVEGITTGAKLYFSWLGSVFKNIKTITTNAISLDWDGNKTIEKGR